MLYGAIGGRLGRAAFDHEVEGGNTINVSRVAKTRSPMMTMVNGRWVSEPMP